MVAYLAINAPEELVGQTFDLTPDEKVALLGYQRSYVDPASVLAIVNKPKIKGMDASSNVYKLLGLYLSAKEGLSGIMDKKFAESDLKQKYFLSKLEPGYAPRLLEEVKREPSNPIAVAIDQIITNTADDRLLDAAVKKIAEMEADVQLQVLMEDLEAALLKVRLVNKSADEIIRDILLNFSNAAQKLIRGRRKGHPEFQIADEYDVQDLLYVILKAVFPKLRDEDPIPKVGGKSTKIDLILREEQILVEVKMIKSNDSNEVHFIEELKVDFESYHQCNWLKKLFCFVYDPYKKTRDLANFDDLTGPRSKHYHNFDVEVIVVS